MQVFTVRKIWQVWKGLISAILLMWPIATMKYNIGYILLFTWHRNQDSTASHSLYSCPEYFTESMEYKTK